VDIDVIGNGLCGNSLDIPCRETNLPVRGVEYLGNWPKENDLCLELLPKRFHILIIF